MPKFNIPPPSARQAKWSIFAIMLLGPLYLAALPYLITIAGTWRAWSYKPARLWRPFTLVSLLLATAVALFWSRMEDGYFVKYVFGNTGTADMSTQLLAVVTWWVVSFMAWSLVLLPHTIARLIHAFTVKTDR